MGSSASLVQKERAGIQSNNRRSNVPQRRQIAHCGCFLSKYGMRKLEELFDLPSDDPVQTEQPTIEQTQAYIAEVNTTMDKIDAALPMVKSLEASDQEMDELAQKATDSFDNLMDLGYNVDSRFAAEIFAVAGTMLGHALTAKTAKLNKKLKMIDLQLKKARLDQTAGDGSIPTHTGQGHVLDRNEILERLIGDRRTNSKKE